MAREYGSGLKRRAAAADESGAADGLRIAVDLLAFGCELWMLATLALSGWDLGKHGLMGISLAIFYPALAIAIWAAWLAPRGRGQLPDPWRFVVQVVLFVGTGVVASLAMHVVLGVIFAAVATIVFAAVRVLDPDSWPHRPAPSEPAGDDASGLELFDDRDDA